jgi:CubicO group peptidase (beta-lactamase class C family)
MKLLLAIGCVLLIQEGYAQAGWRTKTDSVTRLVQQYFNEKNIGSLYDLGGTKFKAAIDKQQFTQATEGLYQQTGQLDTWQFESRDDQVAKYKASFSKAVLTLRVGLDSIDKLETFSLTAYEKEQPPKTGAIPSFNPLQTELDKKVDSLVMPFMRIGNTVGLSIGVLENGQMHVYSYGETAKDNRLVPDGNTLFEIGSITKTFTATLLAYFVQQGKLNLDDPVNKYLPDSVANLQFNGKPITIRSLANHSSGLPRLPGNFAIQSDPVNPYRNYDSIQLFSFLAHFTPTREPGAQYEYSNFAVGLLGLILERISGKSYETLLKEIIWQPLHMNNTTITLANEDSSKLALGYDVSLHPVHSWEFQSLAGAGAIRSCINDLLLYAKAQAGKDNSQLSQAIQRTHELTFESGQNKVGLGWHIFNQKGKNYIAHDGQTGGYCSSIVVNPASGNAVVILTNAAIRPGNISVDLILSLDQK